MKKKRDLRLDFLKGLAIIFIMTNHLDESFDFFAVNYFQNLTLKLNGFADSAAVFIFISGYLFGLIYTRVLNSGGKKEVLMKAWIRAFELYVYTIFFVIASLGIVLLIFKTDTEIAPSIHWYSLDAIIYNPLSELTKTLFGIGHYGVLGIMRLYIILIIVAPLFHFLFSYKKLRYAGLLLTISAYIVSQFQETDSVSLLAWQFPFYIAMYLAMYKSKIINAIIASRAAVIFSITYVLIAFIVKRIIFHNLGIIPESILNPVIQLSQKVTFAPLIVLNFIAWIILVNKYFSSESFLFQTKFFKSIIVVGQNTLEVFCFHSLVVFPLLYFLKLNNNHSLSFIVANIIGWTSLIVFAHWIKRLKMNSENNRIIDFNRIVKGFIYAYRK